MIDKPIIPDQYGFYHCKCDSKFTDLFEFLEHNDVRYEWGVRISNKWTFDLFEFITGINNCLRVHDLDGIYESLQSAGLTLLNSSEGKFEEFMEEAVVAGEMEDIYDGVERLLREDKENGI